ncbi:Ff.00g036520.m01.CDS01 [Fusarium sp. VM40]|nr:Ff.00g036520.m01.CDS01 [Fusarium sp. VM40]
MIDTFGSQLLCFLASLNLCICIIFIAIFTSSMPLNLRSSRRTLLNSTQPPEHPQSDYRIVRFTLDLPNGQTGAGEQPMEI